MWSSARAAIPGVAFFALLALGCATSSTYRYYSLQVLPKAEAIESASLSLVVGPWLLPQYLNRTQIVTTGEGSEIELAEDHRWIEPVETGFSRVLAMNVSSLLPAAQVYEFPIKSGNADPHYIRGRVYRFDVDTSGLAVLDVLWAIMDEDDQAVYPLQRTRYEEQAGGVGSFESSVQAMSRALGQLSIDIAGAAASLDR